MIEHQQARPGQRPRHSESERVRLARAARQAALTVRGVRAMDAGPAGTFVTGAGDGERLVGVTCIAAPEGGYEVSLSLVVGLVRLSRWRSASGRRSSGSRASPASNWRT